MTPAVHGNQSALAFPAVAIPNASPRRVEGDPAKASHLSSRSLCGRIVQHLWLIIVLPTLVQAAGQEFILNAGQSLVFQFASLPSAGDSQLGDFSCFDVNSYSLTSAWVDSFRIEVFENSLDEQPRCVVTLPTPGYPLDSGPDYTTSCGGTNLWRDLQGVVRLTVLAGSVRFQQPGVDVVTPNGHWDIDLVFLSIARSGRDITLSWPRTINTDTYRVQWARALDANDWTTITDAPVATQDLLTLTIDADPKQRFFRLISE